MSGSVRLAAILLTDLVGSTSLATAVGPTRWDELRDEHFRVLREAIASTGGVEVKSTGDGLMVAFSSASAAIRCAVVMQQLIERRGRHSEPRLHARVGLGAGECTVRDEDYYGIPTIEAARLCDRAPTDGILISPMVRTLAGRCEWAQLESIGELQLKGIADPVEATAVLWQPLTEVSPPEVGHWALPLKLRSMPTISYVGRTTERARIERSRAAAYHGDARVVFLSGEPGIGKTRLATYAGHGAHAEGFLVCWGECSEELAVPYEPWIGVCSHIVDTAPQNVLDAHIERFGGELGRLVADLPRRAPSSPAPQRSDPDTERFLLFAAVAGLFRSLCHIHPVCVVLEDLHWADGQSVALLRHVMRALNEGAMQVIVTYRDSELTRDHPLTAAHADVQRMEGFERIALQGLDVDEVTEMMAAVTGHDVGDDGRELASEIASATGGNPFFVGEVLRCLMESEGLALDEETRRLTVDRSSSIRLPPSARDVIDRRVQRLGDDAREVLTHAAVIGHAFDVGLLNDLVALSEGRILGQLEAAVAASLLVESTERVGSFAFSHNLINQTLYEGLGATRRARMHHQIALALERRGSGASHARLGELAFHWRLAMSPIDAHKAAEYARRAGEEALNSLAPAEAARLFADALELSGDADTVGCCRALVGLGEAQRQSGDPAYRHTLLEASRMASALGDAELAASAALANSRGSYSLIGEVDAERLRAIERAIELDDPPVPARRARLLALEAQELEWSPKVERRHALADEAVRLARAAGDARALSGVLINAFFAYWSPETLDLRVDVANELAQSARAAQDPAFLYWSHVLEFDVTLETGQHARSEAALQRMRAAADELDQPLLHWIAAYNYAGWATPREHLADAERLVEHAFALGQQAGEPDAALIYGAQLAPIRVYQGRGQEVVEMLEASVDAYPDMHGWHAGLAQTYCLLGRVAEAAPIVERGARERYRGVAHDGSYTTALALYADAAAHADLPQAAGILYRLIEPWADQIAFNGATTWGHARMWLGRLAATLGWQELADEHFGFACAFQEEIGLLLWAAYARLGWAEALAIRGDAARSREQAARALELARRYGYGAFESRAAALLGAGSSPARA